MPSINLFMLLAMAAASQSVVRGCVLSAPPLSATVASRTGAVFACDWEDDIESEEVYERWKALGLLDLVGVEEEQDDEDDTTPQMMVVRDLSLCPMRFDSH